MPLPTLPLFAQKRLDGGNGDDADDDPSHKSNNTMTSTNENSSSDSTGSNSSTPPQHKAPSSKIPGKRQSIVLALCMLAVGTACSITFAWTGVQAEKADQSLRFEKATKELVQAVQTAWAEYETLGLWIHQAMRLKTNFSTFEEERMTFEVMYQYAQANRVKPQAMGYTCYIDHADRAALEEEARQYYEQVYPEHDYKGFSAIQIDPTNSYGYEIVREDDREFYYPMMLLQPLRGNDIFIDVDIYSSPHSVLMVQAMEAKQVVASVPVFTGDLTRGNDVLLLHPGISMDDASLTADVLLPNRGAAVVKLSFKPFIERIMSSQRSSLLSVYIYDVSATGGTRPFGGVRPSRDLAESEESSLEIMHSPPLPDELKATWGDGCIQSTEIHLADRVWNIIVVDEKNGYTEDLRKAYGVAGLMFIASVLLVVWFYSHVSRGRRLAQLRQQTDAEKAQMRYENAQLIIHAERKRNEYLAHEVRNPLASALSACSFLEANHRSKSTHNDEDNNDREHDQTGEDLGVISSSLSYINSLLRSLLDTNKIASGQLTLHVTPTDIMRDVLEPVQSMLHRRDAPFSFHVDCPGGDLTVPIDGLRLKQVVLNLANNAKKFVETGFIRITARVLEDGTTRLTVEDSGPGIPQHKRKHLFERFQESLDELHQGTGMGLSLCHSLVGLMDGRLYLDDSYQSGVEGFPGAKFVIDLPVTPMPAQEESPGAKTIPDHGNEGVRTDLESGLAAVNLSLPSNLKILLIDDDTVLRKMLRRSIERVAPTWKIREAASGETGITIIGEESFDIIFVDQYMASIERSLLGTETVQSMRSRGVRSRICGLSANHLEQSFLEAGADYFLLKPFSTNQESLRRDLHCALGLS